MTTTTTTKCPAWCNGQHTTAAVLDAGDEPIHESNPVLVDDGLTERTVDVKLSSCKVSEAKIEQSIEIDGVVNVSLDHARQLSQAIIRLVDVYEGRSHISEVAGPTREEVQA